ncbi:MAG: response regulator [Gammaproteobacteria bacterium]|nr:response regulator [Gammaproteobacteria bacterium]
MPHIFIVEDDQALSDLMRDFLKTYDFEVTQIDSGDQAVFRILNKKPDLVILDIMLPKLDGIQVCRSIRQNYQGAILMLTARQEDDMQITGLNDGADDYVKKPVDPQVLLARIQALLRHGNRQNSSLSVLEFGSLRIDQAARSITLGGKEIDLPRVELDLLIFLANNAGKTVDRNTIYRVLRGIDHDGLDRSVDLQISHLRNKLGDNSENPTRIKTVWGKGYLFVPTSWD